MASLEQVTAQTKKVAMVEKKLADIKHVEEEYAAGRYDFQGIRIFSRLHTSVDLDLDLLPIAELLHTYIQSVESKLAYETGLLEQLTYNFKNDINNSKY